MLVLDAESDCSFATCPGLSHADKLDTMRATLVCALEVGIDGQSEAQTQHHFWCDDANGLQPLLDLMDKADVILTFNGASFDLPLLRKHYASAHRYFRHRFKHVDLFSRLRDATGLWISLSQLALANGLASKTGSGLEAIQLWHANKRDPLLAYCHYDVELLAKLAQKDTLNVPSVGAVPRRVWAWE